MRRLFSAALIALLPFSAVAQDLTEEEIKDLALQAILENPQIIVDALAIIQEQRQEAQALAQADILLRQRASLENDPNAPFVGNAEGETVVVEFFDYNCPYCRRAKPTVEGLIEADPGVRIVFREFPILGDDSVLASRAALAARAQGKYEEFHWALMALSGRIGEPQIMRAAEDLGMDLDQLRDDMESDAVSSHIDTSIALAQSLGITGTPSFVVGETLLPGLVDQARLEDLVDDLRSGG